MLYNLSDFLTMIKEDIGIKDIPLPVNDNDITKRFATSVLPEFSVRYPKIDMIMIGVGDADDLTTRSTFGSVTYTIPEKFYSGTSIISVLGINPGGYGAAANMYMPNVVLGSADVLLESISDIKMAAALGSMMAHAPTFEFHPPNKLTIYNGWTATAYRIEIALVHDISLATIPQGAFTHLRQLATLDIQEFLYNKLKRITDLDLGIGNISLKIDNWESAAGEKKDLLARWDETIALDVSRIMYY